MYSANGCLPFILSFFLIFGVISTSNVGILGLVGQSYLGFTDKNRKKG